MKVLSLFSGIGAFEKALDRLEVPYELVNFCEFDKYAIKSYCAIHGVDESKNLGDITKVDETKLPKDIDLVTYGFPCQDISLAGKQKGLFNEDGTQTRSGLFFEALRIIEATQPKVAIAENVKNLVGKKFNAQFQVVLASLEAAGYNNYYKVLNAKDFGIPQNRERVFIVSIRKDIDTGKFEFPHPFPLEKRLKDVLEEVVDEKYYLSEKMISGFMKHNDNHTKKGTGFLWKPKNEDDIASCLRANAALAPTDNTIEEKQPTLGGGMQKNQSVKNDGISTCLTSSMGTGGGYVPMIVEEPTLKQVGQMYPSVCVREATKKGYAEAVEGDSINLEQPNSKTRRGRVGHGVAQTLTTSPQQAVITTDPKINVIGNYSPSNHDASRIVDANGIAPTVKENHGTVTAVAVAMRGRLDEQGEWQQQVEVSNSECANAITTVQKDSLVAEPLAYDEQNGYIRKDGCVGTIMTDGSSPKKNNRIIENDCSNEHLRIRKLTPKECFRLMGFDDESFHKAEAVNSNSQLYKQAGNSIVVDVLECLFCMMIDGNGDFYV